MTDRIDVVRTVPNHAHIEELAAVRHLSAHIEAAHSGLVNTNEVDPPVGDQAEPLIAVDEQLTYSEWCRRFLAKDLEPAHIFRRDRIFHIKRPAELNRLVRRRTLMDVMDQADVIAELRPQGSNIPMVVLTYLVASKTGEGLTLSGRRACVPGEVTAPPTP